ncbi:Ni(2(+)) ABC transporter ATP binding subunit NikD [Rhodovastum atsumiense]|uniref:ATP-binding cassette domain-containing protein n=1 Tax=Rhodovastum atsumiense TaxID=504468 RepID=A0A5M6J1C2_9PROT|nr:ATP-binding cassette domain-containing protein [Rhodovastum atsumiense]KAA5614402.1 ATP-binding cassette domain-containing protein [Rhodovastum atsumiense]CAH2604881.1 Ni(2(+)) ABC transporter ATP binding subunit NikD [Rhodovastum atsumiense]
MSPPDLALRGLRLETGSPASPVVLVDGIDLGITRGRVQALVGTSGGGKSLSTLALLGLLPRGVRRSAGSISLDGVELTEAGVVALRGRTVGLVQQNPTGCFNPIVTIGRHFQETLALTGTGARAARATAVARLAEVGFDAPARLLELYPFQLSGGMLQRVAIALALACDPPFLVADEPTTDLDLVVQAQILDLLDGLRRHRGIGILLVTHDLSVVARLADEVAVLIEGRIVESRDAHGLFATPRDPCTRALLDVHFALQPEALCA